MRFQSERQQLAEACRRVAAERLVVASAGNLSMRIEDVVLTTPRRVWLEQMQAEVCVAIDSTGAVIEGDRRPSSETPFHLAIYRAMPEVRAVVHTHSKYATVLSTLITELPPIHYSLAFFGGPLRVARYATFGSTDLAQAIVAALDGRQGALLRNHGAVTVAESLERALELSLVLEWLCSVYYYARQFGEPTLLTEGNLEAVLEHARALDQQPPNAV